MGLLLLRVAVGVSAIVRGTPLEMAIGALLVVGFITPIAALLLVPVAFYFGFYYHGFVALSLVLLGPGAISIDARVFGRREIIIPRKR